MAIWSFLLSIVPSCRAALIVCNLCVVSIFVGVGVLAKSLMDLWWHIVSSLVVCSSPSLMHCCSIRRICRAFATHHAVSSVFAVFSVQRTKGCLLIFAGAPLPSTFLVSFMSSLVSCVLVVNNCIVDISYHSSYSFALRYDGSLYDTASA